MQITLVRTLWRLSARNVALAVATYVVSITESLDKLLHSESWGMSAQPIVEIQQVDGDGDRGILRAAWEQTRARECRRRRLAAILHDTVSPYELWRIVISWRRSTEASSAPYSRTTSTSNVCAAEEASEPSVAAWAIVTFGPRPDAQDADSVLHHATYESTSAGMTCAHARSRASIRSLHVRVS